MGYFPQERGKGVDVCQRDGERCGDDIEKPTGVAPCGLSVFHQMNRDIADGDSGWRSGSA